MRSHSRDRGAYQLSVVVSDDSGSRSGKGAEIRSVKIASKGEDIQFL